MEAQEVMYCARGEQLWDVFLTTTRKGEMASALQSLEYPHLFVPHHQEKEKKICRVIALFKRKMQFNSTNHTPFKSFNQTPRPQLPFPFLPLKDTLSFQNTKYRNNTSSPVLLILFTSSSRGFQRIEEDWRGRNQWKGKYQLASYLHLSPRILHFFLHSRWILGEKKKWR